MQTNRLGSERRASGGGGAQTGGRSPLRGDPIVVRLVLLVLTAVLIPASALVAGSQYLNSRARLQMERQSEETLNLAINLQQSLIDSRLERMRDRAVTLAADNRVRGQLAAPVGDGAAELSGLLTDFQRALPDADLITVVDATRTVRGRAGSAATGDVIAYGGLVDHVLASGAVVASPERIARADLTAERGEVLLQVRIPVTATPGSTDPLAGEVLEDALALVGAAPVIAPDGQRVLGAVFVADILNNDHDIVDEVTSRSLPSLPLHATISLDAVRVTTNVPAPGGGRRAVGTLYSDKVMERLRAGQDYRGRALVGGWQWERTIYLPLRDHAGRAVASSFVGVPEASFTALTRWTAGSTWVALLVSALSLAGAALITYRLARTGVIDLIRRTVSEIARIAHGVRAVSDDLARRAGETAGEAEAALAVARSALEAAEQVSQTAQQAAEQVRELELALARIDVAAEEQARTIGHAGAIGTHLARAVQDSREALNAVLESTRDAVAAAHQGRHSALRIVAALDLVRMGVQAALEPGRTGGQASREAHAADDGAIADRTGRLLEDVQRGQEAANACDAALNRIVQTVGEAKDRLWETAATLNESGARAGAISRQMTDLAKAAGETAAGIRATGKASREIIGRVERMAQGTEAAVSRVRQAERHVTGIAAANRSLLAVSERIRALAHELDEVAGRLPGRGEREAE